MAFAKFIQYLSNKQINPKAVQPGGFRTLLIIPYF